MKECDILWGVKTYSDPSYIFQGVKSQDPTHRIYASGEYDKEFVRPSKPATNNMKSDGLAESQVQVGWCAEPRLT